MKKNKLLRVGIFFTHLLTLIIILAACRVAPSSPPELIVETLVVTEMVEATPVEVIQVVTPTPEPAGPRALVVCLDEEPWNINYTYLFWAAAKSPVQEAIFDGPFEINSFTAQPVILEKLPSLADGDATITTVTVSEGDTVVDGDGEVVTLDAAADPPIMLIPAGGGDPVPYRGGDYELDQMTVTFKLLPDLRWSDGEPLTAADTVYAFNTHMDDEDKEYTPTYEAIDDLTFQWIYLPGLLHSYSSVDIVGPQPEHIWGQYSSEELDEMEEFYRAPVGWGPYMLEEWVEGESITLRKNPYYFRADEGLPKFDRVLFRFTGENPNTNIAALLAGECDIVSSRYLQDQIEMLLELHEAGKIRATFTTGTSWEHLDFGIQHVDYDDGYQLGMDRPDFFSDVRTRRAFAMCVDRQELVDEIYFGQSLVPDTYVHQQNPLYNPDVEHYDFDVTTGSALLEEVGWIDEDGDPETPRVAQGIPNVPDGTLLEVEYDLPSSPLRQQASSIIKNSLAQCGIKANIHLYDDLPEFFADGPEGKVFGRRYDLTEYTLMGDLHPACEIYLSKYALGPNGTTWISIQDGAVRTYTKCSWCGWNQIGFANDEYDRACGTARYSLPGQPEFEAAHREAQRIFAEQLPSIPLFLRIKVTATRPDMCGVIMDPSTWSEFWNIEEFDYGEGCLE